MLTINELEYTNNAGATWQPCTAGMDNGDGSVTVPVGDVDAAPGTVGVRAKATETHNAGPVTWNKLPFNKVPPPTTDPSVVMAHYRFESVAGGALTDAVQGNNAALVTATDVTAAAGKFGQALSLPGTTDRYASAPHSATLGIVGAMAISVWLYMPSRANYRTVLEKAGGGGYYLEVDSTGKVIFYVNPEATSGSKYAESTTLVPLNAWTHLTVELTAAGACSFYFNDTLSNTHNIGVGVSASTGPLRIGADNSGGNRWVGLLDELYLFNRVLTASERTALYASNTPPQTAGGGGGDPVEPQTGTARFYRSFEEASPLAGVNTEAGHSYSATVSEAQSLRGGKALRLELRATDADVAGSRRVELNLGHAAQRKEWYAFALYLPSANYSTPDPHAEQFCQWHAVPDSGESWGTPAKSVQLVNNKLRVKIGYNDAAIGRTVLGEQVLNIPNTIALNTWHKLVFEIYHDHRTAANGGQGMFRMWLNGELVVDHAGPNSFNDTLLPYFKVGCYKWPWATEYGGQYVTPGCNPRVLFIDDIKIGNQESNYSFMVPGGPTTPVGGGGSKPVPNPDALTWEGPLVITNAVADALPLVDGYRVLEGRNIQSANSDTPAIDVQSSRDIWIRNCNIRSSGYLVKNWYNEARMKVTNNFMWGHTLTAWTSYMKPRRAVNFQLGRYLEVEHNYMKGTAGVFVAWGAKRTNGEGLKVRYNQVLDVDGRVLGNWERVQFVQVHGYSSEVPGQEIAWNEVINNPDSSRVEDNINLYRARGTAASPIRIHNNFIKGAWPAPGNAATGYSGGGIICDSASGAGVLAAEHPTGSTTDWARVACAHVDVSANQIVGSANYMLAVAGGNNITYRDNRCVNSGRFDSAYYGGGAIPHHLTGTYAYDYYARQANAPDGVPSAGATFNVSFTNNVVKLTAGTGGATLAYFPDPALVTRSGNGETLGAAVKADEAAEWSLWLTKLQGNTITVGPVQ